ncbi:MAG TPA: glutaredoxin domain-containing protein [Lysobacter sp.]|nr:glutaredoxin domain-containing protein [Lysobacter sp.]
MTPSNEAARRATLYRMVLPDHVCPFGLRALELLQEAGYEVDDRPLRSREETDAFKAEHGLDTTPLVFVGDERIGGASDLEAWLAQRA